MEDMLEYIAGREVIPLVGCLKSKENVSEFKLAEDLKCEVNYIRNLLYRLYDFNLVYFTRKKDKLKGWYIYYWTFNENKVLDVLIKIEKERIERLKSRYCSENEGLFFCCRSKCVRLDFERATDFEFHCPECGEIVYQDDNSDHIIKIKEQISVSEKRLAEFENELELEMSRRSKEDQKLEKLKKQKELQEAKEKEIKKKAKEKEIKDRKAKKLIASSKKAMKQTLKKNAKAGKAKTKDVKVSKIKSAKSSAKVSVKTPVKSSDKKNVKTSLKKPVKSSSKDTNKLSNKLSNIKKKDSVVKKKNSVLNKKVSVIKKIVKNSKNLVKKNSKPSQKLKKTKVLKTFANKVSKKIIDLKKNSKKKK